MSWTTIIATLKKVIQLIATTFQPLISRLTLEFDELWSYVGSKKQKVWIWLALERETQRIVGIDFGDHSDTTCRELWNSLSADYRKRATIYSDYWESYTNVIPSKRLHQVGKENGETAHTERFNVHFTNDAQAWCIRRYHSAKTRYYNQVRIQLFVDNYNLSYTSQF